MKSRPKIRFTKEGRTEVWAPPRPSVGGQALQRLLMRHVAVVCPESQLWTTVIAQAITDTLNANELRRRHARYFLTRSRDLEFWCDLIGLEVDFVREVATKAGYLVDEDGLWQPVKRAKASRTRKQPEREPACA